MDVTINL